MAEIVGEIVCECGRKAYVEKTKRKGDYLQKRCGTSRSNGCGLSQSTGEWVQANWRENMVPVGTLVADRDYQTSPKQVKAQVKKPEAEKVEPEIQATTQEPKQIVKPSEPEQNRELVEEDSGFPVVKFLVGLVAVAGAAAGINLAVK